MDMTEKTLEQEYVYQGKIVRIRRDIALLPNGRQSVREVCDHVGGVAVLPVDEDGFVYLVRQFRYPYGEVLLEIPAGKMDQGPEGHLACGVRELREETGLTAERMIYLGRMYPSPGFLDEVLHLYAATGLHQGACQPDEDEFLQVERLPLETVCRMIADDEIRDGKTIAAVLRAKLKLGL